MAVIVFLFAFVGFGLINCIAYIFADLVNNRFMVALSPFMMYFFYYIVCSSIGRDGPMEYLTASKLRYSELKFMIIDMVMLIVLITISYFVASLVDELSMPACVMVFSVEITTRFRVSPDENHPYVPFQ